MIKKFYNMNAEVGTAQDFGIFRIVREDGAEFGVFNSEKVLKSYDSIVCVIDVYNNVYLLPRHDYSTTTSRQVSRFVNEHFGDYRTKWEIVKDSILCKYYVTCVAGGFDEYKQW